MNRLLFFLAQAAENDNASVGFLERWTVWMVAFAQGPYSNAWLFAWAFSESSFFILPPDALLIALCLTSTGSLAVCMWFAAVCTVASAAGGAFGYGLGRWVGRPILTRVANAGKVERVEHLLQRYDVWAVGVAGFTPIPYKIFTIASGMLHVNFFRFLVVSVVSRGARFFLVAAFVWLAGEEVKVLLENHFWWVTIAAVAAVVAGFYAMKLLVSRRGPPAVAAAGADGPEAARDEPSDRE